jgi:hypothetical protein
MLWLNRAIAHIIQVIQDVMSIQLVGLALQGRMIQIGKALIVLVDTNPQLPLAKLALKRKL